MRLEIKNKIHLFILVITFSCIEPYEYELIDEVGATFDRGRWVINQ